MNNNQSLEYREERLSGCKRPTVTTSVIKPFIICLVFFLGSLFLPPNSVLGQDTTGIGGKQFNIYQVDYKFHVYDNAKTSLTAYYGLMMGLNAEKIGLYLENKYNVKINARQFEHVRRSVEDIPTPKSGFEDKIANYYWRGDVNANDLIFRIQNRREPVVKITLLRLLNNTLTATIQLGLRVGEENNRAIKYVTKDVFSFSDVKTLLDINAAIKNTPSETAVWKSCFGQEDYKNIDIGQTDKNGNSPLLVATKFNYHQASKHFIEKGASVKDTTRDGLNLLHIAARSGNITVAEACIEKGIDINETVTKERTALSIALTGDNILIAHFLVDKGIKLDNVNTRGYNILMQASGQGDSLLVTKILAKESFNINATDSSGKYALYYAADKGKAGIVKYLLKQGADPDIAADNGYTALMIACNHGYDEIAMTMLEKANNIDYMPKNGWNSLMQASRYCTDSVAYKIAERAGKINFHNSGGWSPLMICIRYNKIETAKLLLKRGADVSHKNKNGLTASKLTKYIPDKQSKKEIKKLIKASKKK